MFLVEDESIVSMLAEDILLNAGCKVILAGRLQDALDLAKTREMDLAVLDVNLGAGHISYPVADLLAERGIPFVFATGYGGESLDQRYSHCVTLQKPYLPEALVNAASAVAAERLRPPPQEPDMH